jgi:hypothetical protein
MWQQSPAFRDGALFMPGRAEVAVMNLATSTIPQMGDAALGSINYKYQPAKCRRITMRKLKLLGLAFSLAAGAFVLTMLMDPPKSVASDPTRLTIQPNDIQMQTGIPTGSWDAN